MCPTYFGPKQIGSLLFKPFHSVHKVTPFYLLFHCYFNFFLSLVFYIASMMPNVILRNCTSCSFGYNEASEFNIEFNFFRCLILWLQFLFFVTPTILLIYLLLQCLWFTPCQKHFLCSLPLACSLQQQAWLFTFSFNLIFLPVNAFSAFLVCDRVDLVSLEYFKTQKCLVAMYTTNRTITFLLEAAYQSCKCNTHG